MGQCDSCHTVTLFGLQMLGLYPRYPTYCAQLCLYQSLPSPWWVNNTKNCTLLWRFGHFTWLTKNAKIAIFQFSTRFLKTFPSTDMGPLYLKKIVKPSSTRIYHKTAQLTHPRPSNSPRKVYPMWRDSRYSMSHSISRCFVPKTIETQLLGPWLAHWAWQVTKPQQPDVDKSNVLLWCFHLDHYQQTK